MVVHFFRATGEPSIDPWPSPPVLRFTNPLTNDAPAFRGTDGNADRRGRKDWETMGHTPETRERAYQKVKRSRELFFSGKSCVKCGADEALELDHIDPETKIGHSIWSWSKKRREDELLKCQVLCHDCHAEKTKEDLRKMFTKPIEHGTAAGYEHKGCRCELCRNARNESRRKRRDKNGHW